MNGSASLMPSGIASLWALYCGYSTCLAVGVLLSKTTAICVGFSLRITSIKVFVKPKIAEVSSPLELILGFFTKAK